MSLGKIILQRIEDKFFRYLRRGPLRPWSISLLIDFSSQVIDANRDEIFQYLANKEVTVDNIEKITDEIIRKILVPYLQKVKFKE